MKVLCSTLLIMTGAAMITTSAAFIRGDEGLFVTAVGCGIGLLGLIGWFVGMLPAKFNG